MALDSYSALKTAIGDWSLASGSVLTSFYDDIIDLAEARLNRVLRVREMETSATLSFTSGIAPLPSNYLEWRKVVQTTEPRRVLEYVTPEEMDDAYAIRSSGEPCVFTIDGDGVTVMPIPSGTVVMHYYRSIPPLTDDATTNWLLEKHPGAYLHACCLEAAILQADDELAQKWLTALQEDVKELRRDDDGNFARARSRVRGVTP
jgi:hypothetical protein